MPPLPAPGAALQIITVLGLDGEVRWVSPSVSRVLGVSDLSSPGTWGPALVHPDDRPAVADALARAAAGEEVVVEHRVLHTDGHWIRMRSTVQCVPAGDEDLMLSTSAVLADEGEVDEAVPNRDEVLAEFAAAIAAGQIEVHYQPIVRPSDGAVVKVEALARWRHPVRGLVPPAAFVPIVERSPLIGALGAEVLRQSCSQVAAWRAADAPGLELSVNLSVRELDDPDLADRIATILADSGLPAYALWLEVTETALASDSETTTATLQRLRSLGVRLSLDDFGTGFAHLAQLRRFPVQALKIDRTFVAGMEHNPGDAAIVRSVIALGRELGLTVIAEGVETDAERDTLVALRCDLAQGFLFGRPVPPAELRLEREIEPPAMPLAVVAETPEELRLAALRSCRILDTPPEPAFDGVVRLIAERCAVPIAAITLLDEDRQWFKASIGLDLAETPRDWAISRHIVAAGRPLVVTDASADPRFAASPLVTGDLRIRAYAGVPLVLSDGYVVGALSAVDRRPRHFDDGQLDALRVLAAQVVAQLELRRAHALLGEREVELAAARDELADARGFVAAVAANGETAMARVTPQGVIEFATPAVERLIGWKPSDLVGTNGLDIVHPDDVAFAVDALLGTAATLGQGVPMPVRLRRPDGTFAALEVMAHTYEEHDGQRRMVMSFWEPSVPAPEPLLDRSGAGLRSHA